MNPVTNSSDELNEALLKEFIDQAEKEGVGFSEATKKGKQKIVQYFSRSKHLGKILSNFRIIHGGFTYNDRIYLSLEAAFQAAKLDYLQLDKTKITTKEIEEEKKNFEVKGTCDTEDAKRPGFILPKVKQMGMRKYYKEKGMVLNKREWDKQSIPIMRELVKARYDQDPQFKILIDACAQAGLTLKHLEWRGIRFWGTSYDKDEGKWKENSGELGGNWHGKLLMELYHQEE